MRLIVGLGNPGRRYRDTRHNVGWDVLDRLATRWNIRVDDEDGYCVVGRGSIRGQRVWLAKPQTYMNLSGTAVRELLRYYRLSSTQLVVVCDDLDMPVGIIRVRPKGGHGGHNGLRSLIDELGTQDFARVRVGIGRPTVMEAADYVLARFGADETRSIAAALDEAADAVEEIVARGPEAAMARFNRKAGAASRLDEPVPAVQTAAPEPRSEAKP